MHAPDRCLAALTLAATMMLALAPRPAAADDRGDGPRIEGAWFVTITPPDPSAPLGRAVATYAAGGALTIVLPSPPGAQTIFAGAWERNGRRRFRLTALSFVYDPRGTFVSIVRLRETVTLEPDGDTYQGLGTVELLDIDGNLIGSLFEAPVRATRIRGQQAGGHHEQ